VSFSQRKTSENRKNYEKVPCWVYSNIPANLAAAKEAQSPIIWPLE